LYNLCLLITTQKDIFRVVGIQTDDTLFLRLSRFANLEEKKLQKARLTAKPRDELSYNTMLLLQKDQGKKLKLVNLKAEDQK